MIGKIHFGLQAGGHTYGAIKAENWRAWNFRIEDPTGAEVARITKTWEGWPRRCSPPPTTTSCRSTQSRSRSDALVVASALSVDTALKQDARGFG